MRTTLLKLTAGGALLLPVAAFAQATQTEPRPPEEPVDKAKQWAEGKMLFMRDWAKEGRLNSTGDGLGPMYNAASCVACHRSAGVGGAGENKHNVALLSIVVRSSRRRPSVPPKIAERAAKVVHPGFSTGRSSLVLHRHMTGDAETKRDYDSFCWQFVTLDGRRKRMPRWNIVKRVNGLPVRITQRNTPALFGAGLIDAVPDKVIIEAAERQRTQYPGISGRVPQTNRAAVGRFGWRGQTATLHDFVLGACANELGLEVPNGLQPTGLIRDKESRRWSMRERPQAVGQDLYEEQCKALTAFVAKLPAPHQVRKMPLAVSRSAYRGEKLFHGIGCAVCHVPDMGPAKGVYSDLLLHDMGEALSDPLAAVPEINEQTAPGFTGSFGYYGSDALPQIAKITTDVQQEWRTPPLWGVADSAPYLHDGRAATLEEAILLHAGEAGGVKRKFQRLERRDRDRLITFLQSLVAPGSNRQPVLSGRSGFGISGLSGFPGFGGTGFIGQ